MHEVFLGGKQFSNKVEVKWEAVITGLQKQDPFLAIIK